MKVQHPTIPNIQMQVAASKVDDWLAMGWQLVGSPPAPSPEPISQTFPTPGDVFSVSQALGGPRGE